MTISEGDTVRLLEDISGANGALVSAGTEGFVVSASGRTVVVDLTFNGEPDNVIADSAKVEIVRKG